VPRAPAKKENSLCRCGKHYFEGGTDSNLAVESDFASVKLDCTKRLSQSDAGAALLRRVVKIEYSFLIFFGYPDTSVSYQNSGRPVLTARSGDL
jgi:hypothetical protein